MAKLRHKWSNDPGNEAHFPDSYRIEKCVVCGLLKLHIYRKPYHLLEYVKAGKQMGRLPECEEKKPLELHFSPQNSGVNKT